MSGLLHDNLRLGIDEANERFVTDLVCDLPDGDTSFLPLAKEAFDKNLVDPMMVDWPFVEARLQDKNPQYGRVLSRVSSDFSDIEETLGWQGMVYGTEAKNSSIAFASKVECV